MEQGGHVAMVYIMVKIHPVLCKGMEGQDYSQFWLVLAGELHDEECFLLFLVHSRYWKRKVYGPFVHICELTC